MITIYPPIDNPSNGSIYQTSLFSLAPVTDQPFLAFYAERLVWQPGGRVAAQELLACYAAWAAAGGMPALSARHIRREMVGLGHPHRKSSRMHFANAAILDQPRGNGAAEACRIELTRRSEQGRATDRITIIEQHLSIVTRELAELRRRLRQNQ